MTHLVWVGLRSCVRWPTICSMSWLCLRNGILLKSTALMHVSNAVILAMASHSALNPSINLGPTKPSPNSPDLEADVVTMVVALMVAMGADANMVHNLAVVMAIEPSHAGSGKVMLRLWMHSPLLVALENIRASCCMPLINVPYKRTFGTPDQGQTLDVWESQTAESALRDDWLRIVPHHTLEVALEVILEHMCAR